MLIWQVLIFLGLMGIFIYLELKDQTSLLSSIFLFLFFIWATVTLNISTNQKIVCIGGLLFYMIVRLWTNSNTSSESIEVDNKQISGIGFKIITILAGMLLFGFMIYIQSKSKLDILGYPKLQAVGSGTGLLSGLSLLFAPFMSASVGLIENRMMVMIFLVLEKLRGIAFSPLITITNFIPIIGPVIVLTVPLFTTSIAFAILHLAAYGFVIGALGWPLFMMIIWLAIYMLFRDIMYMDISHGFWNGLKTVGETLSISG